MPNCADPARPPTDARLRSEYRCLLAGDLLLTGAPLRNPVIPFDTNDDSSVSPIDSHATAVNEMQVFTLSGTMPNAYGAQGNMGLNWRTVSFVTDNAGFTWSMSGYYDDDEGGPAGEPQRNVDILVLNNCHTATVSTTLTVHNVAPTISVSAPAAINEGEQVTLSPAYNDAVSSGLDGTPFMADMLTAIDKVLATDEDGNPTQWLNPGQIDESEGFTLRGAVSDPGVTDTVTATLEVDLNFDGDVTDEGESLAVALTPDSNTLGSWTFEHTISEVADDGPSPGNGTLAGNLNVAVHVTDDDSGMQDANAVVSVNNVAPQLVGAIIEIDYNGDGDVVAIGVMGQINDLGRQDVVSLDVTWSDGFVQNLVLSSEIPASPTREFSLMRGVRDMDGAAASQVYPHDRA